MVEVKPEDLEFLKDEYREAQRELSASHHEQNRTSYILYKGMKRGLETALIRLGVSNDELDSICQEVYQKFREEVEG